MGSAGRVRFFVSFVENFGKKSEYEHKCPRGQWRVPRVPEGRPLIAQRFIAGKAGIKF